MTIMPTETLTLTLPPALAQELGTATQEFWPRSWNVAARRCASSELLNAMLSAACRLEWLLRQAGISRPDLPAGIWPRGMEPPFSDKTLAEELG